ncbi:uncharacterized protein K460DRAFT_367837 [Cucurbitaria berberidis CBS 394.84]|uniref:Uncharacterized protein n=1 Tax=Cucurbitaria berberidis CBS 394.84 TaxID=1168544 RepID=A0A9P4GBP5_9PLEO|nr:uncharacterized protein K460DRAFT_367837 [Cucurbitaria berberidis CBS 394.84]KAF1842898.1 hypothetical protein K460DRAFT_367837 [Cucurbitaria berberidis CBS 394.84]
MPWLRTRTPSSPYISRKKIGRRYLNSEECEPAAISQEYVYWFREKPYYLLADVWLYVQLNEYLAAVMRKTSNISLM